MPLNEKSLRWRAARALHRLGFLRQIAKKVCRGMTIRQSFWGGVICLDAVDHSWAWTNRNSYEKFDRPLQDALLQLSQERPWFVDIGSNLGAMTLSVLLRNPRARAVTADPNPRAVQLLRKSIQINRLTDRAQVFEAAIAPSGAEVRFDFGGSVTGHVATAGSSVPTKTVAELLRAVPAEASPLIKVDVEGFESQFLAELVPLARGRQAVLVIELHPVGMNGWGDPARAFEILRAEKASTFELDGRPLANVDPSAISHVVARWS